MKKRFSSSTNLQQSFLVIGYGNEFRGDDGVGPKVAKTVADWNLPAVRGLVVNQLLPELAADLAEVDYVVFVDACGERSCATTVQLAPISWDRTNRYAPPTSTHSHSVRGLLALTQRVYGYAPQAWMLQIPTEDFGFGATLSTTAKKGCDRALRIIEQFLINYQGCYQAPLAHARS